MPIIIGKNLKKENGIIDKELNNSDDQGYKPGKKISPKKASKDLIKGLAAGSLAFMAAFLIMAIPVLTVPYILRSFIAMVFAFLVIKSYDKTSGEVPTSINIAVASAVIMLFTLSLIWGYNTNKDAKFKTEQVSSESGTVRFVNDAWFTDKIFEVGSEATVQVLYHDVQQVDGPILTPGIYHIPINNVCRLAFKGIVNDPVTIKVTYK